MIEAQTFSFNSLVFIDEQHDEFSSVQIYALC